MAVSSSRETFLKMFTELLKGRQKKVKQRRGAFTQLLSFKPPSLFLEPIVSRVLNYLLSCTFKGEALCTSEETSWLKIDSSGFKGLLFAKRQYKHYYFTVQL